MQVIYPHREEFIEVRSIVIILHRESMRGNDRCERLARYAVVVEAKLYTQSEVGEVARGSHASDPGLFARSARARF